MAKIAENYGNTSKGELSLEEIDEKINNSEKEYIVIKNKRGSVENTL